MAKLRQFTMDMHPDDELPPVPGDLMTTARKAYEVVESRPVESRVWCNRWKITLRPLDRGSNDDPPHLSREGQRWFPTTAYRRGETPLDHFGVEG